ncbi:hypothetical protein PybrP1_006567 [[Pythium] brassicae (nom. inval.)]|nr:hypothetical protein PybrP1_006567 [[Pythium] brassicae (nom. inval.)]
MVTFTRRRKLLNAALLVNLMLSCALLLATLFLLETPFVGFDAFVTAGALVAYAFSTVVLLNKAPSAYAIGYVVGSSLLVLALTFEGALYWGLVAQANGASKVPSVVACALHGTIFCVQLAFTVGVVQSKEDFIDTYAAYEYIPDSGYGDRLSLSNGSPTSYQATAPTADI